MLWNTLFSFLVCFWTPPAGWFSSISSRAPVRAGPEAERKLLWVRSSHFPSFGWITSTHKVSVNTPYGHIFFSGIFGRISLKKTRKAIGGKSVQGLQCVLFPASRERKGSFCPGCCGSVDWASAWGRKGHLFGSWPGHMPRCGPVPSWGHVRGNRSTDQCFSHPSMFLSHYFSLPLSLKINK